MESKDWYAWINFMPPIPDDFHIVGEVEVPNPGVEVLLVPRVPQGINPHILMMDLHLVQKPGAWPQVMTWVQCRYDRILGPGSVKYTDAEVWCDGQRIASMKVDEVH